MYLDSFLTGFTTDHNFIRMHFENEWGRTNIYYYVFCYADSNAYVTLPKSKYNYSMLNNQIMT